MKKIKRRKLTKGFKLLLITILVITGFLFFNKEENEEYLANVENVKSRSTKEYIIDNIKAFKQNPAYPTGCESVSLYILLNHYSVDVTVDEIIEKLPKGNAPYEEDNELYGANPEKVFIGSPYSLYAFGVFEVPIKNVANKFKSGAISKKGIEIEELQNIIKSGSPLIAWTRIDENLSKLEYVDSWIDEDTGKRIKWPSGEHAVVVYCYDDNFYYISNPDNGEKYPLEKEIFEYNFELMGSRVVYYEGEIYE